MENKTYSLSPQPEEPKTYSMSVDVDTPLKGNELLNRAFRYHMTLGDDSPGVEEIQRNLSIGLEDQYQSMLQNQEMARRAETGKQLVMDNVQAGTEADPQLIAELANPGTPPEKATVLEEQWTKKAFDALIAADDEAAVAKAIEENPMGVDPKFAAFEQIAFKNLVVQKWKQKVDTQVANTGWGAWTGYMGMQLIQFPTWANIVGNTQDGPQSSAWYTAGALGEKVAAIRAMDPVSMDKAIKAEVEALAAVNPLDAQKFVDALISYAASDADLEILNDLTMLPIGMAGKALAKSARGFREAGEISEAIAKTRKLSEADKAVPATGVAGDAAKATPEPPLRDPVDSELAATTRAVSSVTDVPTAMAGTGKPKTAAQYALRQEMAEKMLPEGPGGLQRQFANMTKKLGSWFNTKVKVNAGDNHHTGAWVDMEPVLQRFIEIATKSTQVARVSRVPEDVLAKAFQQTEEIYSKHYNRLQDMVVDIEGVPTRILPGETALNVGMIRMHFGKKGKELFEDIGTAQQAIRAYGLPAQSTYIKQSGGKYYLETYATVGEDKILDLVLTPENALRNNTWTRLKGWLGSKSQTSDFQSRQRSAVVHSEAQMGAIIREVYAPYEKLGKRSRKALDEIMRVNQLEERIPGDPSSRGMYYRNGPELERSFMTHLGRLPTADEVNAYFAVVRASDLDWMYRSFTQFRLKAVQGFENVTVDRLVPGGRMGSNTFEGRIVDAKDLPLDARPNIDVLFVADGGIVNKLNLRDMTDEQRTLLKTFMAEGNSQVIQPYQPRDPNVFKISGSEDPIAYVIASNVKREPLRLDKQVNYRPGFHNEYKAEWFLKQAKTKNGRYEGDVTAMGFRTEAELKKFGERMEHARKLLVEGKLGELNTYLKANLPMDLKTFQKMFDEHLDKNSPFTLVKRGKKSTEGKLVDGRRFTEAFGDIDTTLDDFYNPSASFGDPFVAQRDPVLWEIRGGTEDNPAYELKQAELFSPMLTQTKAMGKLIKSELYNDYQLSSASHWVETFAGDIWHNGAPVSREQLRRNPLYYLKNGELRADPVRTSQAEQLRLSIQNLVGQPSQLAENLDFYKQKLMSSLYEKWGEKYLDYVPEKAIPMISDPVKYMRSIAFHTKLGLFNPVQFFVQGMSVTNVVAISPTAGVQSFAGSLAMRSLRLTEDPKIIAKAAENAANFPGWSKETFTDAYDLLRRTGFDVIDSGSAWRDDVGDPTLYRSKAGKFFLDWGPMFFNAGERAIRLTAWNTAYLEYAGKFPKKVGKFNEYDVGKIRERAQALSGNMTRDANSFWQNDARFSLFTQFWSYNVRMGELMLGHQLTPAESARLAMSQMMLWGVTPMAAIAYAMQEGDVEPVTQMFNPYADTLLVHAAKNGIDISNTPADFLYRGVVSMLMSSITGEQLDFGSRYGMSAPQVLDSLERTMKEDGAFRAVIVAALGPSGSIVNEIFKESSNVFQSLEDLVLQEGTKGELLATDLANAFREISSVNTATKLWAAAHGAAQRTQNGAIMSDGEDPPMDFLKAMLGVDDISKTMAFDLAESIAREEKEDTKLKKHLQRYSGELWDAYQAGDYEKVDRMKRLIAAYAQGSRLSSQEILNLVYPQFERNQEIDRVIFNGIIDKMKGERKQNLREEYNRRFAD